uniref:Putative ovule protein n=1 Tax=Solanum chacoense TaxID=4108 RepID=A0A0V0GP64_SOLCH
MCIPLILTFYIRWLRFRRSDKLKFNYNLAKRSGQLIFSRNFDLSLKYKQSNKFSEVERIAYSFACCVAQAR